MLRPIVLISTVVASACAGIPEEALRLGPESLADRQMQTRRFDTSDERRMLQACASLLQDVGFNLDETEMELGVLVGSKERSAVQPAEVAASVLLMILFVWLDPGSSPEMLPYAERQLMRVSVVTRPVGEKGKQIAVRVTFQRIVWDSEGNVRTRQGIREPTAYQEFFSLLSKAVFLEAHAL